MRWYHDDACGSTRSAVGAHTSVRHCTPPPHPVNAAVYSHNHAGRRTIETTTLHVYAHAFRTVMGNATWDRIVHETDATMRAPGRLVIYTCVSGSRIPTSTCTRICVRADRALTATYALLWIYTGHTLAVSVPPRFPRVCGVTRLCSGWGTTIDLIRSHATASHGCESSTGCRSEERGGDIIFHINRCPQPLFVCRQLRAAMFFPASTF